MGRAVSAVIATAWPFGRATGVIRRTYAVASRDRRLVLKEWHGMNPALPCATAGTSWITSPKRGKRQEQFETSNHL